MDVFVCVGMGVGWGWGVVSLIEGEHDCGEQIIRFGGGLDHKWRGLCIRPRIVCLTPLTFLSQP